jgi:SAM-dependent methyltransferase
MSPSDVGDVGAAGCGGAEPTVDALYAAISPPVEEAMLSLIRELALATPAPARDPFYGLDRIGGPSLRLLDRLTRHGDFRKYVVVLDAGAGLGGAARWLALRYGCRVVALDACPRVVAVGARLSRRARLTTRVRGVAASFEAVPARDGVFTQVWSVEALHHALDRRRALAELFRVLRPGCTLALQEIVRRSAAVPPLGAPWRHGTIDEYLDALDAAGFHQVVHEDVTAERPETSSVVMSARGRLERLLATRLPAEDPWHRAAAALRRVDAIVAGPGYRVVHFFARRPSI